LVNCTNTTDTNNFGGPPPESGQRVTVYPNLEETGRANITIYNWDEADSAVVDVSGVLAAGAPYKLHNAQDYYGDIVTGNVAIDGTITVDMRAVAHTVAAVIGWDHAEVNAFPTFGCFILEAV
jgi:hypothetical protein